MLKNINCNNNIFNSLTEINDEEIKVFNNNDNDNVNYDKIPLIISVKQILEKYINFNDNYYLSVSTLLNIISNFDKKGNKDKDNDDDDDDDDADDDDDSNIIYMLHNIYLPTYSRTSTVSII